MKFLWKLHDNFGCHGNRSWKNLDDISYENTEPILYEISYLAFICWLYKI